MLHAARHKSVDGLLLVVVDSDWAFKGLTEWVLKLERSGWRCLWRGCEGSLLMWPLIRWMHLLL